MTSPEHEVKCFSENNSLEVENKGFRTIKSFDAYLCFLIILSAANLPVMMQVGVPAGL